MLSAADNNIHLLLVKSRVHKKSAEMADFLLVVFLPKHHVLIGTLVVVEFIFLEPQIDFIFRFSHVT